VSPKSESSCPPGWGLGFRDYDECMDYIRANGIKAPDHVHIPVTDNCLGPRGAFTRLSSPPVSAFARRLVTPLRGQGLPSGLRLELRADLLQRPDAGTERVAILVDNLGQLPEQRFGLFVCQFKVHTPEMGALTK
jgi:hypothetical protein